MYIDHATQADLPHILAIYERARAFMRESGNPNQWGNTNPPPERVKEDIAQNRCMLVKEGETVAAVFYFARENDPTYAHIDGAWVSDTPYAVVHRIASAGVVRGAAKFALDWAFEQSGGHLRIDTHDDNLPMQHLLTKCGFTHCGTIHLQNGDPRRAYCKVR